MSEIIKKSESIKERAYTLFFCFILIVFDVFYALCWKIE